MTTSCDSPRLAGQLVLRQSLARLLTQTAEAQDFHDAADLLRESGYADAAGNLEAMALLLTGLPGKAGAETDCFAVAFEDLAMLAPTGTGDPGPASPLPPGPNSAGVDVLLVASRIREFARLIAALEATDAIALLIAELVRALATPPDRNSAPSSVEELAARVAAVTLERRIDRLRALALPPFGSPAVLHAAARLHPGALGPFLDGLERMYRGPVDLLALATAAAKPGGQAALLGMLYTCSSAGRRAELIDLLGDIGDEVALEQLFWAETHSLRPQRWLFHRTRDALLDLGALGPATDVQRWIVARWPDEGGELVALGELEITGNNRLNAARHFAAALRLGHDAARERLAATRSRRADRYRICGGFGSSAERRARRRAAQVSFAAT